MGKFVKAILELAYAMKDVGLKPEDVKVTLRKDHATTLLAKDVLPYVKLDAAVVGKNFLYGVPVEIVDPPICPSTYKILNTSFFCIKEDGHTEFHKCVLSRGATITWEGV